MGNAAKTISYLKRNGLKKTLRMSLQRLREDSDERGYERERLLERATRRELAKQKKYEFKAPPLLSVVIPAYNPPQECLNMLLDSILLQSYERFEIILADAGSEGSELAVAGFDDERLVYIKLDKNGGISENTNAAIKRARGDVLVFIDHDDFIEPDAFFYLAKAFDEGARIAYTDEDKFISGTSEKDGEAVGRYFRPNRKCDFNYDLLLSNNYISHLTAIDAGLVRSVGALRSSYDGAQDYDLLLRCADKLMRECGFYDGGDTDLKRLIVHVPRVLYHWRVHGGSTADNPESKSYAYEAGRLAVEDHMRSRGIRCSVRHTEHLGFYAIDYEEAGLDESLCYVIPEGIKAPETDVRLATDGIFARGEVRAVVYRVTDVYGRTAEGPYKGKKWWDSGVMHRAAMSQDIEPYGASAYCIRKGMNEGLTVYLPWVTFRR